MTRKRVDKLIVGDHVQHRGAPWRVTHLRNPGIPGYRSILLRQVASPHEVDQLMYPCTDLVEMAEEES